MRARTSLFNLLLILVFSTTTTLAPAQAAERQSAGTVPPMVCARPPGLQEVATGNPEIREVKIGEGLRLQDMTGEAALDHFYNVLSRKPKAFSAARKALAGRGFAPTNTVFVERTVRLLSPASTSETSPDGEIVFWSWDDGDNGTWEGAIYVEVYADGAASTWEGQLDTSTQDYPWIEVHKTWEGGAGGGGGPLPVSFNGRPPLPGSLAGVAPAVQLPIPFAGAGAYTPVSFYQWARCWRGCVVTGCGAAAVGCLFSDGGWPGCWAGWCLGSEASCAVGCYLTY
jgi:hypothetical protein